MGRERVGRGGRVHRSLPCFGALATAGPSRFGRYLLRSELGRGATATVYHAYDPDLRRDVALKILSRPTPRFETEARSMCRIEHPNLVRVFTAGVLQGRGYLVMELLEGGSLEHRLTRGPLPALLAAEVALGLARGLAHVHGQGLLHRDVKPANVILRPGGSPALTDFGLAKDMGSGSNLTRTGAFHGSPGYWPPEQALGQRDRIGPASDVFGLGATLYAMLTGRPPGPVGSLEQVLYAATSWSPPSPAKAAAGVPPGLDAICLRCLAADPEDRYPTAQALGDELEAFLAEGTPRERGRPGLRSLLAGGLVLALAVAAGVVARWDRTPAGASGAEVTPSRLASESPPQQSPTPVASATPSAQPSTSGRETAAQWLAAAERSVSEGRHAEAVEHCGRAIELEASSFRAYRLRGWVRARQRDFSAAIVDYGRALLLSPNDALALAYRAVARQRSGDSAGAESDVAQALAVSPDLAQAQFARVITLTARGERDSAWSACERLIELEPDYAQGYLGRGILRWQGAQPVAALEDLDRARLLDPHDYEIHYNRAIVSGTLGAWDEAEEDLTRALALAPDYGDAFTNRSRARIQLGRPQEALEDLEAALRVGVSPRMHDAVLANQVDARRLLASHEGHAGPDTASVSALEARAQDLCNRGEYAASLAVFDQLVELVPSAQVLGNRGTARAMAGQLAGAVEDFTRGLELEPRNLLLLNNRADARRQLGQMDQAHRDLQRALSLEPRSVTALSTRSRLLRDEQRLGEALRDADQVLEWQPGFPRGRVDRAAALTGMGHLEPAIREMELILANLSSEHMERSGLEARLQDLQTRRDAAASPPTAAQAAEAAQAIQEGVARADAGDWRAAERAFTRAIRLQPQQPEAWARRAVVYVLRVEPATALLDCQRALALEPDHALAEAARGTVWGTQGQLGAAKQALLRAKALDPTCALALASLGVIHAAANDFPSAIEELSRALELEPVGLVAIPAWRNRGLAHDRLGQHAQAVKDFSRALELEPGVQQTQLDRAVAYISSGNLAQGIADCDQVLKANPRSKRALELRAQAEALLRSAGEGGHDR